MAAQNVGVEQLLTAAGAEQKPRLAVTDELNQQLRHVLREVYFTLPVFRLEVIVNFAAPCLPINDDAGAAVENLLDADTQRLTNAETARTTEDEKHTHLRLDGRRVGKMVHHFNREALTALFLLDDLWDDQAHLFPITWVDFLAVLIDAGRKHHLHHLEVILDGLRPRQSIKCKVVLALIADLPIRGAANALNLLLGINRCKAALRSFPTPRGPCRPAGQQTLNASLCFKAGVVALLVALGPHAVHHWRPDTLGKEKLARWTGYED